MPCFCFTNESGNRIWSFFAKSPSSKSPEVAIIPGVNGVAKSLSTAKITNGRGEIAYFSAPKFNCDKFPDHLKSCYEYCCIVSRRNSVEKGRLVRLLLAEGLIPEKTGEIMEDRADNIIDELLVLGVLQKSSDRNGQQISSTSQEFCLVEADEQDFVAKAANLPAHAIIEDDGKNIPPSFKSLQIQSLFVITAHRRGLVNQGLSGVYIETLCGLQSLSLLDLDGVVEYLPDEVGDLVHLRYLGLANSKLQGLPKTLANLQKLQTLDIRFCNLSVLPMEILNFQQLRHLLMENELLSRAVTIPNGIGKLVNLHTCTGVFAGCGIFNEFSSLTQLQKFGVTCVSEDHASELFAAIMKMKNLTSLSLRSDTEACEGTFFPDMEQFSPPPLLQELHLDGRLFEMPQWLASMENLTTLFLSSSCLYENPTSVLQFLPKLQILTLWEAYQKKLICKEFCNAGGFPALQSLTVAAKYLVEWTEIANGAFPSLRCLSFNDCPNLMFLPEGLQNIKTLESLYLRKVHEDLVRRLMSVENYKVKHISDLKFK